MNEKIKKGTSGQRKIKELRALNIFKNSEFCNNTFYLFANITNNGILAFWGIKQ